MSRFTIDFSDEAAKEIDYIASSMGLKTKSEVVRKALTLLRYAIEQKEAGGKLIFENPKLNERTEIVTL